jgi:hypothetical protein
LELIRAGVTTHVVSPLKHLIATQEVSERASLIVVRGSASHLRKRRTKWGLQDRNARIAGHIVISHAELEVAFIADIPGTVQYGVLTKFRVFSAIFERESLDAELGFELTPRVLRSVFSPALRPERPVDLVLVGVKEAMNIPKE